MSVVSDLFASMSSNKRSACSPGASSSGAKRQQLQRLAGLKGVSSAALSKVLGELEGEVVEGLSAWQINKYINTEFQNIQATIELPMADGTRFKWVVCRPDLLVKHFAETCAPFRSALASAVERVGAEALGTIWYLDEVVPGNLLRPDNKRKFWGIYLGIEQFAPALHCREQFWLPVAMLRANIASSVEGGISQAMRMLIKSTLLAPWRLASAGMALDLGAGGKFLRFRVSHLIADESALKAVWSCKGASGTRFCFLCSNLVALSSGLADDGAGLVHQGCSEPNRFRPNSDEMIWQDFDRLASERERLTKVAFGELERASGGPTTPSQPPMRALGGDGHPPRAQRRPPPPPPLATRPPVRPELDVGRPLLAAACASGHDDLHGLDAQLLGEWHRRG